MIDPTRKDGGADPQLVEIIIGYDQRTGQVSVKGPTDQELLFFGMLELAKLAVIEKRRSAGTAERPRIVVPPPLATLRGGH